MAIRVSPSFSYKIRGAEPFSARKEGWLFLESVDLAKSEAEKRALSIGQHCGLIQKLCQHCVWMVESPSRRALDLLRDKFPNHVVRGQTIGGHMEPDLGSIELFWSIFAELDREEPWNQEQPWAIAGIVKSARDPDFWTVEDMLKHPEDMESVFVQAGWFAFLGVKRTDRAVSEVVGEFPYLFRG